LVQVDLFFFCVMVGYVVTHRFLIAAFVDVSAQAVSLRQLVSPGTLVFLGRAR
jgi:hypothetical protein